MEEAGETSGGDGACPKGGGSGKEAATVLPVLLEDDLRRDVGGGDAGAEAVGLA